MTCSNLFCHNSDCVDCRCLNTGRGAGHEPTRNWLPGRIVGVRNAVTKARTFWRIRYRTFERRPCTGDKMHTLPQSEKQNLIRRKASMKYRGSSRRDQKKLTWFRTLDLTELGHSALFMSLLTSASAAAICPGEHFMVSLPPAPTSS